MIVYGNMLLDNPESTKQTILEFMLHVAKSICI